MLMDLKSILGIAEERGCAIGAFNVYNMETLIGVVEAVKETGAPVIIQMYSRLFDNRDARYVSPMIYQAAKEIDTPICFHLDHGAGIETVMRALRVGVTGAMIDASTYPLEENIAITRQAVTLCTACGVTVEGELGHVGGAGDETMSAFTDVEEAARFVKETGVSALAVMVGTAHGHYKKAPVLDIQRIRDIHEKAGIPVVLHGGSGVPDDQIRMAIKAGVRKINFATDICCAFLNGIFEKGNQVGPLDRYMVDPTNAVKEYAIEKIRLLGADLKA